MMVMIMLILLLLVLIANIYWAFSLCQAWFQSALYESPFTTVSIRKTGGMSIVLVSLDCYNKICRLGGLNNIAFSRFWRWGSPRSGCQHGLGSWWGISSLLADNRLTVSSQRGDTRRTLVSSSSYKDTNSRMGTSPSWLYLNLITSHRPQFQTPSYKGLELQHMNFQRT